MRRSNGSIPFIGASSVCGENAHHQLSRLLVGKYAVLGIETLNVAGMDKLRHQARSIRDAAIGGLLRKIRYKADWYGTLIMEA